MNNTFVKLMEEEFEALKPKRGAYDPCIAFLDLKLLLYKCNRVVTKRVQMELVTLDRWEEAFALSFLQKRWRWKDASRVSRNLKKWQKLGFISVRKSTQQKFNILGLTIDDTTQTATVSTTQTATVNAIGKHTDNQQLTKGSATVNAIGNAIPSTIVSTIDDTTNKRRKNIEENKEKQQQQQAHARYNDFPYGKQIISLLIFFESDIGKNSLKTALDAQKIEFPPTTKHLVKEVESWALKKYTSQPLVLQSYKDGFQCWGDFSRLWLPRIPKNWEKVQEKPRKEARGKVKGAKSGDNNRIFKKSDYQEGEKHNEVLFAKLKAKKEARKKAV